jgi:hypothetical protein
MPQKQIQQRNQRMLYSKKSSGGIVEEGSPPSAYAAMTRGDGSTQNSSTSLPYKQMALQINQA